MFERKEENRRKKREKKSAEEEKTKIPSESLENWANSVSGICHFLCNFFFMKKGIKNEAPYFTCHMPHVTCHKSHIGGRGILGLGEPL